MAQTQAVVQSAGHAQTLVEQYADVNIVVDGMTPLSYACQTRRWDLIKLLIQHGASDAPNTVPAPITHLSKPADRDRFSSLLQTSRQPVRPPRLCPCWSGKLLQDCHDAGKSLPYPHKYVCRCGSGKNYGKCCAKRGIILIEEWDAKDDWIRGSQRLSIPLPDVPGVAQQEQAEGLIAVQNFYRNNPQLAGLDDTTSFMEAVSETMDMLLALGWADKAYVYAQKRVDFVPRPVARRLDKKECKQRQHEWNVLVDEYIVSGVDPRPRLEIERQAKIGVSQGTLFPKCLGPGCGKTEVDNAGVKLQACGGCKIALYCSEACQNAAWKEHKPACRGHLSQVEQMLPTQERMVVYMGNMAKMMPTFLSQVR